MKSWWRWTERLSEWRAPAVCLLIGHLVFAALLGLWQIGLLQPLELLAYDQALRQQTQASPDDRIVLIGETEADIHRWGYPLPDGVLAEALERLAQAQPLAIGVDKYRDIAVPPGSEKLAQVLRQYPQIVWIMKFRNPATGNPAIAAPAVLLNTDQVGFGDIPVDTDGQVRRGLLYLDDGQEIGTGLALKLVLRYLQPHGIVPQPDPQHPEYLRLGTTTIPPLESNIGSYVGVDAGGYQYLLDYRGQLNPTQVYTLTDVLEGRVPVEHLSGKIVLLGGMAESLRDDFLIPARRFIASTESLRAPVGDTKGRIAGVALHALQVNQLLRFALGGDTPIRGLPGQTEWVWLWLWCLIGIGLSLWRMPFRWTLVLLASTLSLLLGTWYLAFLQQFWLPLAAPTLGLTMTAAFTGAYLSVYDHAEKEMLMSLFARHMAPEVADALWRDRRLLVDGGRLLPQRLTATVLFTDIRGFTTISEGMEPAQLMNWLNVYMEAMTQVVMTHQGVVKQYIGDAVMALFGVPTPRLTEAERAEDAINAVQCALAMGERLEQLNTTWVEQQLPTIAMRVGIHTGPLVAGSLGGRRRIDYTVIGDTVNTASRLESFDKGDHDVADSVCRILIGEATFKYLNNQFQVTEVGRVKFKGKHHETTVYRIDGRCHPLDPETLLTSSPP